MLRQAQHEAERRRGYSTNFDVALAPDLAAVEALRPEWAALWAGGDSTPFQAPACLIPWARTHAPDRSAAVVVRDEGRLVGLLPVFAWEGALLLAGTGPTDYNDGVFAPARTDVPALAMAGACALADACGHPTVDLRQLRPQSPLVEPPTPAGWRSETRSDAVCPVTPLLGADGLDALPRGWPAKVRYSRRRCEAAGGRFELATTATLPELLDALERLHARRWAAEGKPGVLADPLMRDFVRLGAPDLMDAGLLRFGAIRIGGKPVAALLALAAKANWYFYLIGFDPDFRAVSPGTTLIACMFEAAVQEGATAFDFLRGQEPYKYHWGAVDRPTVRRTLKRE